MMLFLTLGLVALASLVGYLGHQLKEGKFQ
jgi:hypothetical protein